MLIERLSSFSVHSARLLLLSKVGNHSDQVGCNLLEHIYLAGGGYVSDKRFYS
jgi:hypothetical protein